MPRPWPQHDAAEPIMQDASVVQMSDARTADEMVSVPDAGATDRAAAILHQSCKASTDTNSCYRCEDEHCCETFAAFNGEPEAHAYRECLSDCIPDLSGPASCEEACDARHPRGTLPWARRMACIWAYCSNDDACGARPLNECELCALRHCSEPNVASEATREGYLHGGCVSLCPYDSTTCFLECHAKYPLTTEVVEATLACHIAHCPDCQ
jgi:hypothetical protein